MRRRTRLALSIGLPVVLVAAGLAGHLGYRTYQHRCSADFPDVAARSSTCHRGTRRRSRSHVRPAPSVPRPSGTRLRSRRRSASWPTTGTSSCRVIAACTSGVAPPDPPSSSPHRSSAGASARAARQRQRQRQQTIHDEQLFIFRQLSSRCAWPTTWPTTWPAGQRCGAMCAPVEYVRTGGNGGTGIAVDQGSSGSAAAPSRLDCHLGQD
jgi:hypothetical protein